MTLKKIAFMMFAATAVCVGFTSCGSDDDDSTPPSTVSSAEALAGTYNGNLTISVMGQTSTDEAQYIVKKVDDTHVSLTTPASGSGAMALPEITVSNIPAEAITISGVTGYKASVDKFSGTLTVNGAEKAYTFTDLLIMKTGNDIAVTYSLQYDKMPMAMACSFTTKK